MEDTISEIYVKYIETIIPEDDSVRLHSQFVEAMDLTDNVMEGITLLNIHFRHLGLLCLSFRIKVSEWN